MNPLRIGVVGLGFGQLHVYTLANMHDVRITALADKQGNVPGGMDAFAARYGAKAYASAEEMIEREELDAISICTSPRYREKVIRAAAAKGIPMFVEKPWAANLEHARHLANLCRELSAKVMMGFSFRFHPVVTNLRQLMDSDLGEGWILSGEYIFSWVPPDEHWLWQPDNGNGFFNENSCHLIDVVCYLMGEPLTVSAEGINPLRKPSETGAVVNLTFEGGRVASLMIGCLGTTAVNQYPRIHLITQNGQAQLLGREHYWETLLWNKRGDTAVHQKTIPPESLQSMRYTHAFQHFFDCIRSGKQPCSTIEDGVRAVALADAIYRSIRTGQKVPVQR